MDAERWQRVQELFEAAVDLASDQQDAFLQEKCGGDEALLKEVRSLIGADNQPNQLLDRHAVDLFEAKDDAVAVGQIVGSYRIIERIASGGMGAVYQAERADGQFSRKVALKLIRRGMVSEEMLRRFKSERQILANLNHPNISRLIDGGLTEDGVPWFTMEYVVGEPIDVFCDREKMTIRLRLELFLDVCRAVQYAQQNLVIHRDLKPSNITVMADGTVKLLDFGIAKIVVDGPEATEPEDLTRTGLRVMTPGYASPEQVSGQNVSTASDVYSLGVVLYRLLTGGAPYRLTSDAPLELERAICHTDPKKPSAALIEHTGEKASSGDGGRVPADICAARSTPKSKLQRQLSGDLDNICLMALRKEPERRYQSAGLLADDLERYLAGHPVRARKDALGYRAGKFFGRHRLAVSLGAVALVLFTSLIVFYTSRLARERDRAQIEAAKAEEISGFLTSMFEIADPGESGGEQVTAREILDRGAARIEAELGDQPETQAAIMAVVGRVYNQLGLLDKADTILTKAMNLRLEHLGPNHSETSVSIHDLAVLAYDRGEYDRAEALYRQCLSIDKELWGEEHATVAADLNDLAAVLKLKGDVEGAVELFEKALDMRMTLFDELDPDVAHSMNHLGGLLHELGEDERAETLLQRGLEIRRELYGDGHFEVVASLGNLASFHSDRREYDQALPLYQEALAILNKLVGEDHHYVGGITNALGNVHFLKGEYATAETVHRKSLQILTATLPEDHVNLAYPLVQLGYDLIRQNRPVEAEEYLRTAVSLRESALPEGHWQTAQARAILGLGLAETSRLEEGRLLLENTLPTLTEKQGYDHWFTSELSQKLIGLYSQAGLNRRADSLRAVIADAQ